MAVFNINSANVCANVFVIRHFFPFKSILPILDRAPQADFYFRNCHPRANNSTSFPVFAPQFPDEQFASRFISSLVWTEQKNRTHRYPGVARRPQGVLHSFLSSIHLLSLEI